MIISVLFGNFVLIYVIFHIFGYLKSLTFLINSCFESVIYFDKIFHRLLFSSRFLLI